MSIPHPSSGLEFSDKLERLVANNLHAVELDNNFLVSRLYMSEARLYRMIKQHYDLSPNVFIRRARLQASRHLLESGRCKTVKEAAFSVGFTHVGYFIRRFEQFYGYTPGTVCRGRATH